ncbi:NADPH-dependent FMN reductase [Plantactinospora sp. GCM10030261]|uniref:NADPH-dependent FMN reductase n=1 Tax=Plantactinospora sp. GCM10030261 TaxID=3273420 RepID=UPI00361D69F5
MTRIAIITASTRSHRRGKAVAEWALDIARKHGSDGATFESLDVAAFDLPAPDVPALYGLAFTHPHTRRWAEAIASFDGYVFVTPEYNHGVPGPLKNAIDHLFYEWNDKAVGFVSYGVNGGVRAVEQLRQIGAEIKLADVRTQVALNTFTDFDYTGLDPADPTTTGVFAPAERHADDLGELVAELIAWSGALASVRNQADNR